MRPEVDPRDGEAAPSVDAPCAVGARGGSVRSSDSNRRTRSRRRRCSASAAASATSSSWTLRALGVGSATRGLLAWVACSRDSSSATAVRSDSTSWSRSESWRATCAGDGVLVSAHAMIDPPWGHRGAATQPCTAAATSAPRPSLPARVAGQRPSPPRLCPWTQCAPATPRQRGPSQRRGRPARPCLSAAGRDSALLACSGPLRPLPTVAHPPAPSHAPGAGRDVGQRHSNSSPSPKAAHCFSKIPIPQRRRKHGSHSEPWRGTKHETRPPASPRAGRGVRPPSPPCAPQAAPPPARPSRPRLRVPRAGASLEVPPPLPRVEPPPRPPPPTQPMPTLRPPASPPPPPPAVAAPPRPPRRAVPSPAATQRRPQVMVHRPMHEHGVECQRTQPRRRRKRRPRGCAHLAVPGAPVRHPFVRASNVLRMPALALRSKDSRLTASNASAFSAWCRRSVASSSCTSPYCRRMSSNSARSCASGTGPARPASRGAAGASDADRAPASPSRPVRLRADDPSCAASASAGERGVAMTPG